MSIKASTDRVRDGYVLHPGALKRLYWLQRVSRIRCTQYVRDSLSCETPNEYSFSFRLARAYAKLSEIAELYDTM